MQIARPLEIRTSEGLLYSGIVPVDVFRVGVDPIPDWVMNLVTNRLITIVNHDAHPSNNEELKDPFESKRVDMSVHFSIGKDVLVPYGFFLGRINQETAPECFNRASYMLRKTLAGDKLGSVITKGTPELVYAEGWTGFISLDGSVYTGCTPQTPIEYSIGFVLDKQPVNFQQTRK